MEKKHLVWRGRQWQFRKRLPPLMVARLGKTFFIKNLGTADILEARRLRDRLVVELQDLEKRRPECDDAEILEAYSSLSDKDREGYEEVLLHRAEAMEAKGEKGAVWFKRVTGQVVPVSLNVDRWTKESPVAATTQAARRSAVDRFVAWCPLEPHLRLIDKRLAGNYVSHLVNIGLAPKSVNSHVTNLSSYWAWLVKKDLVDSNPWKGQSVSGGVVTERESWTPEEVRVLLQNAPQHTAVMMDSILIAALSGLRASEIAALKVKDCSDGFLTIHSGKSKAARRRVPVHSQLVATIERRTIGKSSTAFLLQELGGSGKSLSKRFTRHARKLAKRGLIDLAVPIGQSTKTFHSFRHYWMDQRLKAGCPLSLVQELGGHKISGGGVTTAHYYHGMTETQAREIVEAVGLQEAVR